MKMPTTTSGCKYTRLSGQQRWVQPVPIFVKNKDVCESEFLPKKLLSELARAY